MKKVLFLAVLTVMVLATAASATTVFVTPGLTAPGLGFTTKTVNFDSGILNGVNYSGNFAIVSGNLSNVYKAPTGIEGKYITTGIGINALFTINPGATYNYFGLYWGSFDAYNDIRFFNGTNLVYEFNPAAGPIPGLVNGDYSAFMNFFITEGYDRIEISSNQAAFESANHTFGQTPEPGSLALFGTGLLGLGGYLKRRFFC